LVADATLASFTDVAFLGTLDGAHALTLSAPTTYLAASIGGTDPLTSLTVPGAVQLLGNVAASGGTLSFTGGVSGPGWLFAPDASVATRLAGSVSVGSFSATGPAVLLGNTTVSASSIAFGSTIDGPFALALNSAGTTTLGGAIGSSAPLTGLTTDAGGTTHLGANVTASGALGFNDAVVVDANATLAAGPAGVSFASTVDGPGALVVNTGGTTSFAGVVGSSTPLGGLTTDAAGSTTTHGVIASGAITFNDTASLGGTYATGGANFTAAQAVTLTAATTIDAGVGNVGFGGSVDGGNALSVASNGATSFAGTVGAAVALASLATDAGGTTALSGNVFTVGTQHYGDAVTLTGNRFLLGSSLAFDAALALGSGNVVLAADTMSFGPTLSGSGSLIVEPLNAGTTIGLAGGAGTLQLTSAMLGQLGGLSALTIGNSGDSGTINAGALTLPTATTIVSGSGDVNFGAITGAHSLDVQTGGVTRFGGAVSGLTALSTDLFGSTELGAAISVAGPVTFADAVTLAGASSVSGTVVDFGATVNGPFALAATGTTQVRFDAAVGGVTPLAGLSTSGPTRVAGIVTTSGAQAYQGALTLAAASTSLGGTDITFGGTVDGATSDANALAINASGVAALQGSVGSTTRLASLSASGGSATIGGNISAAGNVQFNDPAQLTADATLASATGYVAFVGPLDGVHALTTSAGAFSYFGSTVGATTPLTSLTTQGSDVYVSAVQANNTLQTSGAQTYNGTVHLLNNTSFSGSALAFLGGVDGAAWTFATN
ncbi:MAG TPA: hypothetical protein VLU41_13355, partial [Ideonella sp.]|nr:hypothetical protein [Ideonella sp.]